MKITTASAFISFEKICIWMTMNKYLYVQIAMQLYGALHRPRITSKLLIVKECTEALNELAATRPVCVTWVQGQIEIQGNKCADQLAWQQSLLAFIGREPLLLDSLTATKMAIRDWAAKNMINAGRNYRLSDKKRKWQYTDAIRGKGTCLDTQYLS